ncbi:ATP binding protein [Aureococcus anophagefferens]|nr:ATP binding protein [Aureococcus anophagefferens]
MVRRETRPDALTLHPSWTQLRSGRDVWYAHRFAGACSGTFFPAPLAATCGGCLCDDVGLGKSIQLIGLVLSNPAPPGWAADALPATTTEPVAVKSTLLVCPAALLPQWEQELATHVKEGALTVTTYLGLGNKKMRLAAAPEPEEDDEGPRRRRRRGEAAAAAAPADAGVEVLARKRHLFGDGDGAAPDLAACDVVLCSFETLRDELRKCHFDEDDGLPLSTPLGAVGFWRVVLDEAQLVCQTTSKAALMCSAILRRHAWVVTGTPINRSPDELHGLLAFLGVAPLSDKHVFDQLYLEPYKRRQAGSRGRLVGLLKGLMLRRGKDKPGVAAQVKLPPLVWETETLAPSPRGARRLQGRARRLGQIARGLLADGARRGERGAAPGAAQRRPDAAPPDRVPPVRRQREARDGAKASGVVDENGEALAMSDVLRRLALKAEKDATRAAVAYLEARALHANRAGGESVDEILDDVAAKRKDLEAVEEDFSRWDALVKDLEVLRDTPPKRLTKKSFTSKALAKVLDKVDAGVLRRVADQARTAWRDKQASRNYLVRELANAAAAKDGAEVEASEPQCPVCLEDRSPETA